MKTVKRILAVMLCAAVMTVYIPSAFAQRNVDEPQTEAYETPQADFDGQDVDLPEEEPENNEETIDEDASSEDEITEEPVPDTEEEDVQLPEEDTQIPENTPVQEHEDSYQEVLVYCVESGTQNVGAGLLLVGAFFVSPAFWVIPPVGAVISIISLPAGVGLVLLGTAEIVTSPVLAIFIDTDTDLVMF